MKKKCSRCKEYKDILNFCKDSSRRDGLNTKCRLCNNIMAKKYRQDNKELLSKKNKIRYKKNKLYYKEYKIKWVIDNKDKLQEYRKLYCKENKDKIKITTKKYYKLNKEVLAKQSKLYRENNKALIAKKLKKFRKNLASYKIYSDKLTVDESPRLADDGISLEVKCRYCGKYFGPTNLQVTARVSALNSTSEGDRCLYCSEGCKESCPIFKQIKYPKGFKKASSREVNPIIRQMCFERDDWTCQVCGASQKSATLHSHHIEGVAQNPRLGNDVKNTITLCKVCHKEVHKLPGCNYYELRCNKD